MTHENAKPRKNAEALFEALSNACLDEGLPYASFYFTYLQEHFLTCAERARTDATGTPSPFVYAMQ